MEREVDRDDSDSSSTRSVERGENTQEIKRETHTVIRTRYPPRRAAGRAYIHVRCLQAVFEFV